MLDDYTQSSVLDEVQNVLSSVGLSLSIQNAKSGQKHWNWCICFSLLLIVCFSLLLIVYAVGAYLIVPAELYMASGTTAVISLASLSLLSGGGVKNLEAFNSFSYYSHDVMCINFSGAKRPCARQPEHTHHLACV